MKNNILDDTVSIADIDTTAPALKADNGDQLPVQSEEPTKNIHEKTQKPIQKPRKRKNTNGASARKKKTGEKAQQKSSKKTAAIESKQEKFELDTDAHGNIYIKSGENAEIIYEALHRRIETLMLVGKSNILAFNEFFRTFDNEGYIDIPGDDQHYLKKPADIYKPQQDIERDETKLTTHVFWQMILDLPKVRRNSYPANEEEVYMSTQDKLIELLGWNKPRKPQQPEPFKNSKSTARNSFSIFPDPNKHVSRPESPPHNDNTINPYPPSLRFLYYYNKPRFESPFSQYARNHLQSIQAMRDQRLNKSKDLRDEDPGEKITNTSKNF